jgi:hypothetical protein
MLRLVGVPAPVISGQFIWVAGLNLLCPCKQMAVRKNDIAMVKATMICLVDLCIKLLIMMKMAINQRHLCNS